jgi:hypothetical protein
VTDDPAPFPGADRKVDRVKRLRRFLHHHPWAHALAATLFLSSATVLLEEYTPILEWLDIAMLRIVPSVAFESLSENQEAPQAATDQDWPARAKARIAWELKGGVGWAQAWVAKELNCLLGRAQAGVAGERQCLLPAAWAFVSPPTLPPETLVVTIQQDLFETRFNGQSPIPRRAFTTFLERVVKTFSEVKVLGIDYDLSPFGGDREERKGLDKFLTSPPRPGLKIVLIHHLPVETPSLCRTKKDWEQQMQDHGVVFGRHELVHHSFLDVVVKYEPGPDHFAHQLSAAAKGETAKGETAKGETTPIDVDCGPARTPHGRHLERINFLRAMNHVHICPVWSDESESLKECAEHAKEQHLAKKQPQITTVVVAADYDYGDRFITPVDDKTAGGALHAYAAYSIDDRLQVRHGLAFLLDSMLGWGAGWIFLRFWMKFHETHRPSARLGLVVLNLGFATVVGAIVMLLGPAFLVNGIWMNPGPMLIGLFVDSWHTGLVSPALVRNDGNSARIEAVSSVLVSERAPEVGVPTDVVDIAVVERAEEREGEDSFTTFDWGVVVFLYMVWAGVVMAGVGTLLLLMMLGPD